MDRAGRTPLHYAALEGDVVEVGILIARGADVNAADSQGYTPLHFACQQRHLEAARALLDAGSLVDAANALGNTPLSLAVKSSQGEGDLIRLLRERGANPLLENVNGKSPAQLARSFGDVDLGQYFSDLPD